MPLSTDNQDYGEKDKKNADAQANSIGADKNKQAGADKLTSDDLKGKKVDGDPSKETDKPANM